MLLNSGVDVPKGTNPAPQAMLEVAVATKQTSLKGSESESLSVPPEAMRYANSVHNALGGSFGEFDKFQWVAVTLAEGQPVAGHNSYRQLTELLKADSNFGNRYRSLVTIIGPRRNL